MPHFFIDTSDEAHFVRDGEGIELEDLEAAVAAAAEGLPDMARDMRPNGAARQYLSVVRDDRGRVVAHASLTFSVRLFAAHP